MFWITAVIFSTIRSDRGFTELQVDVVESSQAGLVNNGPPQLVRQDGYKLRQGHCCGLYSPSSAPDATGSKRAVGWRCPNVSTLARRRRWIDALQILAVSDKCERIYGQVSLFPVHLQLKPIFEERLQHGSDVVWYSSWNCVWSHRPFWRS